MKSIVQENKYCLTCGSIYNLHNHHIYFGVKNRKISDENGFTCWLCHRCHEGTNGIHGKNGHKLDLELKRLCQKKFEETRTREEFICLIGKNYLD